MASQEIDTKKPKELTSETLKRIVNEYLFLKPLEIRARIENPHTPAIEAIVGVMIGKILARGDHKVLSLLLDRLIGPVTTPTKGGGQGLHELTHEAIKQLVDELEKGEK